MICLSSIVALDGADATELAGAGYQSLPLPFELNRGQTAPEVSYLARGNGYTLFLTEGDAVLSVSAADVARVVHMELRGALSDPEARGRTPLRGRSNYFVGNDPQGWHADLPTYGAVEFSNVYPGVDVRYYGNQGRLEYDFIVHPEADPGVIRLLFDGANQVRIGERGDLRLSLGDGLPPLCFEAPVSYQNSGAGREIVASRYQISKQGEVGFLVDGYDKSRPLVIDPVLDYGTFLGGLDTDQGLDIQVDDSGNVYVTGRTSSVDFPTTAGALDESHGGSSDAFVTKLSADGSSLVYSTFLGGSESDIGHAISVGGAGEVYLTGETRSSDFPTTAGAFDTTLDGAADVFVTKLTAAGNALLYSTYLGGNRSDRGFDLAVDAAGSAFVTGVTDSPANFPTTAGAFDTSLGGSADAFVLKLDSTASGVVYGTYLGGDTGAEYAKSIAIDAAGNAHVTGFAGSIDFPVTLTAFDMTANGGNDIFVTRLDAAGSGLLYSTFLGGSSGESAEDLAIDAFNRVCVAGYTTSSDFPTTVGAYDTTHNGSRDVVAAKLDLTQSGAASLVYSTFIGGSGIDHGNGIAVDPVGAVYLTGYTWSSDFPTTANAHDAQQDGIADAVIATLDADGSSLTYATFLGGGGTEQGSAVAVDTSSDIYVTGYTSSGDFDATAGAFDTTRNGGQDAFVVRFEVASVNLSGIVFEDADFAGTATGWDGGSGDAPVAGVDVELYSNDDTYLASAITDVTGRFNFTALVDGTYKVRVRSATIGDIDSPPSGTLNPAVPALWPYPLAEMTWGHQAPLYGGQDPLVDDTSTGDNAGPGDTYLSVSVAGNSVTDLDFGFAYNLIVNAADDSNPDTARSRQGSLRQFLKNANAVGSAAGTTANQSEFRMGGAPNQSRDADSWWRITGAAAMPDVVDGGTVIDGSTQRINSGLDSNSRGPEIELFGNGVSAAGLRVANAAGTAVNELVINSFADAGVAVTGASAAANTILGCYIGTDAVGESSLANETGVLLESGSSATQVGDVSAGAGNLIAHNTESGVHCTEGGSGNEVAGNVIRNNGANGVDSRTDDLRIVKNLILDNAEAGIRVADEGGSAADNNQLFHNTIHGNGTDGILVEGSGTVLRNSILTGNGGFGVNVTIGSMIESANDITDALTNPPNALGRSNVALDPGDPNADPLYVDAGGGDFTLTECASPAINVGVDLAADQPDMNGDAPGLYSGPAPELGAYESACSQGVADLALSKVVDVASPFEGDPVAYTVTLTNDGPHNATNIEVTDVLPSGVAFLSAAASQGTYDQMTGLWSVGNLANGSTATLDLSVTATASVGTIITNTATITGADQLDLTSANNTGAVNITVRDDSGAIMVTGVQPETHTVRPGGTLEEVFRLVLYNSTAAAETLTTLTLDNTASGAQAQLDGAWAELSLMIDGNDPSGPAAATSTFFGGSAVLGDLSVALAAGDSLTLTILSAAALGARDSDHLDLVVGAPEDIGFSRSVPMIASWPLDPPGHLVVDGMVAAQIAVQPIGPVSLAMGSERNLAFEVVLPPNGYDDDELSWLNIVNLGTAEVGTDLTLMEAWRDDGDAQFNASVDARLGAFLFTGDRWELTGLVEPVSPPGLRVFVTVDVASAAREGRTVRLGVPTVPDAGVGMASDNDGPLDVAVVNLFELPISAADRVTLTAVPAASGSVFAGDHDVLLFHLVAINSYTVPKTIRGLTFTNSTTGSGTQGELDSQIEQLILRFDENRNGTLDPGADPIVGTSVFDGGVASMSGFSGVVPPGGSSDFFLTANVSPRNAADGDVLSATLAGALDIDFDEPTAAVARWPVGAAAQWTVDGMLAAQITNFGAPVATLSGGDGPVLVLDLLVPANGYASDELHGLRVVNAGTASDSDAAELRLWRDDGDGLFTGGADELDLGEMVWLGDGWGSAFLSEPLTGNGARLFVTMSVATTPTDSATVRLAVPLQGIATASGNSGPIDAALVNPHTVLISSAPLLTTLQLDPPISTVGTAVTAHMIVRNVGDEQINAIAPSPLVDTGTGGLTWLSGPQPPSLSLAAGATDTLEWTYTALQVGDLQLTGNAQGEGSPSGLSRRSTVSASNLHAILEEADRLALFPVGALPAAVNRGETRVVALNLTFTHDGGPLASDALLRRLRLRFEDDQGAPIVPADLLSGATVSEGSTLYLRKTAIESAGSEVALDLATPVRITSLEPVTISISLDISAATEVPFFRTHIADASFLGAEDAVSGAPVAIDLEEGSYPISSRIARVRSGATELSVSTVTAAERRAQPGDTDIPLLTIGLENLGIELLTADVHLASFTVAVTDTHDVALPEPAVFLERLGVVGPAHVLADLALSPQHSSTIELRLSPFLAVAANVPEELVITADIPAGVEPGAFRLHLEGPTSFVARDGNTGEAIPTSFVSTPIRGPTVLVEVPAGMLLAGGAGALPRAVTIGSTDLTAMNLLLQHPGEAGTARIRGDNLTFELRDQAGTPMVAATFLERLRVFLAGVEIADVPDPPATGNTVAVALDALLLEPGETVELAVVVDLAATAPSADLELRITAAGMRFVDATSGADVEIAAISGLELPLTSGLTQLRAPASELLVSLVGQLPTVLVADGEELPVGRLSLINAAESGPSSITVEQLAFEAADRVLQPIPIGSAVARLDGYLGGVLWAESGPLAADQPQLELVPVQPLVVESDTVVEIELRAVLRQSPGVETLRIGLSSESVAVVQPASELLAIAVEPAEGLSFPMWTGVSSFTSSTLEESYSNFPNPFAAGRETTSFVYFLPEPGRVSMTLWSSRGEHVITLLDAAPKPAGLHQTERWDGRNGRGNLVTNDVFLAELRVMFDSGNNRRLVRKVAVIR